MTAAAWAIRAALRIGLLSQERIIRVMGFEAPQGIPVPIVLIQPLNLRLMFCAITAPFVNIVEVAIFAKAEGAPDWTAIGGGQLFGEDFNLKAQVDSEFGGDEVKFIKTLLAKFNTQLDDWLRTNYQWEQVANPTLLSESQWNALPSEVDQLNWAIAKYAGFYIDPVTKKIDLSVT